jgi:hypothetical protein
VRRFKPNVTGVLHGTHAEHHSRCTIQEERVSAPRLASLERSRIDCNRSKVVAKLKAEGINKKMI